MRERFRIYGLSGCMVWAAALVLQDILTPGPLSQLLGIMPNFGAVWLLCALVVSWTPKITGRDLPKKALLPLVGIVLAGLLVYEIIADQIFLEPFDWWNIAASLLAAGLLLRDRTLRAP